MITELNRKAIFSITHEMNDIAKQRKKLLDYLANGKTWTFIKNDFGKGYASCEDMDDHLKKRFNNLYEKLGKFTEY